MLQEMQKDQFQGNEQHGGTIYYPNGTNQSTVVAVLKPQYSHAQVFASQIDSDAKFLVLNCVMDLRSNQLRLE